MTAPGGWSPPNNSAPSMVPATKVDIAYTQLRNEIFFGSLAPGAVLDQEAVADRLGLSTTPIREALRRLESERLVISRSHRDTIVAPVSLDLVENTYAVRLSLDPLAAAFTAAQATDEQLTEIERLCVPPTYDDPVLDLYRNRAMHRAIYAACGNPTLVEILDSLWDRTDRYRLIVLRAESLSKSAHREHKAIVRAVVSRDADTASKLMRQHLTDSLAEIRSLAHRVVG